jgi:hypothetical protein
MGPALTNGQIDTIVERCQTDGPFTAVRMRCLLRWSLPSIQSIFAPTSPDWRWLSNTVIAQGIGIYLCETKSGLFVIDVCYQHLHKLCQHPHCDDSTFRVRSS